jgi:hypothetical protein
MGETQAHLMGAHSRNPNLPLGHPHPKEEIPKKHDNQRRGMTYSQTKQDLFALMVNEGKPGFFYDIGCSINRQISVRRIAEIVRWCKENV